MDRIAHINALIGTPYALGAQGPEAYDCYSLTRAVQERIFGRIMPSFAMPASAGRIGIASAIAVHPERQKWLEIRSPADGAIMTMARNTQGYHMGTWLADDGGVVIHALEIVGVVVDTMTSLQSAAWRRFRFYVPA